jgi:hypothetical protein
MSNLVSVRLEMVLVSVQDRCTICAKHTIGLGIILGMVLLDDEAQVEARFCLFGDSANLDIRWVHYLHRTYHRLEKSLCTHPMELLGDVGHVKSCFGPFGDGVKVNAR